jgi:hypothetical protein
MEANSNKNDTIGIAVTFTSTGAKLLQPLRVKIQMPETTEELRDRLRLLSTAVEFMKIRLPQSLNWATSSEKLWHDHVEYILGPKVKGKVMTDTAGNVLKTPSWGLLLHYEYEIRSKACTLMNEGHSGNQNTPMDIASALQMAQLCPELRQEEFLEKFQLQSSGSASSSNGVQAFPKSRKEKRSKPFASKGAKADARSGPKGGGKNKKIKVKGKEGKASKGEGKGQRMASRHEGKEICYNYHAGTCTGGCGREHVCQICFAKHTNSNCPSKA